MIEREKVIVISSDMKCSMTDQSSLRKREAESKLRLLNLFSTKELKPVYYVINGKKQRARFIAQSGQW